MSFLDDLTSGLSSFFKDLTEKSVIIPVVRLEGVIAPGARSGQAINLAKVEKLLAQAFNFSSAPLVVILINSPGGSPVQSKLIHDRIRQLSEEKKKPVMAYCEDYAASGGYMIACAGDEIICDPSSLVGSIGVIAASFGFTDLMEKAGIERRMDTAGDNKSMNDPFSPRTEFGQKRLRAILDSIHATFKELVTSRRGDKLKDDPELFSGAVYTGAEALELGLVDQILDLRAELRERYGDSVKMKMLAPSKPGLLSRLTSSAVKAGAETLETESHWSRWGL
ncbi:S49 family peptidase [Woodsholea maritima]|uniref:S49 family peptidase n=1 Tax=Woodsholea maritima TaxID=240237 RepID=UPI000369F58B|nr:S49 family peptidase [Woodsholea maritima]